MPRISEKRKIADALCEQQALDLLMVDSSDEEEEDDLIESFLMKMLWLIGNRRTVHLGNQRLTDWREKSLHGFFDDSTFFKHVSCIRRREFIHILELIENDDVFNTFGRVAQIPVAIQLKLVFYRLGLCGDEASIRSVADFFGVGHGGTVQKITIRVFKAILNLKNKFIYWPNEAERLRIVTETRTTMPGCIGYAKYFKIKLTDATARKHDLVMQVICDNIQRIRHISLYYSNDVEDKKKFSSSRLARNYERYFSNFQWIAATNDYPAMPFIIKPFEEDSTEHTKDDREIFNDYFSYFHGTIDKCFKLVTDNFISLKELKLKRLNQKIKKESCDWIMICCIIHNIVIDFYIENAKTKSTFESISHSSLHPKINNRNLLFNFIKDKKIF